MSNDDPASSTTDDHTVPLADDPTDRRRRGAVIAASATIALFTIGGVGYSYWTSGGSGTGAAVAGDAVAIVVNQTSTINGMGPDVAAQTLSGDFDNTNSTSVYVEDVTASIAGVTKDGDAVAGTCDATDFTLTGPVMAYQKEVPVGAGVGDPWSGATIEFNNKPDTNQDACKGATVNLAYVAG